MNGLRIGSAALAAALVLHMAVAGAQAFPSRPVRIINPNPPGGAIDIQARLYAQKLQEMWAQPVLVEYKTGAGTMVGIDYTAKSAPDGYTIGMAVTTLVVLPALRREMPYDTIKDLAGVSLTAASSMMIAASLALPARTLAEVIALAKQQPGKITYATPGPGGANHLAMELLQQSAGIQLVHVPFKGGAQAYPELMAGRVDLQIDPVFGIYRYVKAGKMKGIAVTSAKRDRSAPEVPTVADTLAGFEVLSTNGIIVPRATPRELVRRLSADFRRVLQMPDVAGRFAEMGLDIIASSPEEFDAYIRTEIAKWTGVAKSANIHLE